jgi:hypothetical protein
MALIHTNPIYLNFCSASKEFMYNASDFVIGSTVEFRFHKNTSIHAGNQCYVVLNEEYSDICLIDKLNQHRAYALSRVKIIYMWTSDILIKKVFKC